MNEHFATAMSRALEQVRAGAPAEATRLIQAALAGGSPESGPPSRPARSQRPVRPFARGADIEDAEVIEPTPKRDAPTATAGPIRGGAWRGRPRRRLRDAVDALARGVPGGLAGRLRGGSPRPGMAETTATPVVARGATYEWRTHAEAAGSRDFRLYVPAAWPQGARGLVVMLHGCTQTPDDFACGTAMNALAERQGLIVAYPSQSRAHNAQACWNWFRVGDQLRDAGEPAIIAGMTRALVAEFAVDPSMVFVAGLSAGGAMAAILAEAYPELFAAFGVHSGLPAGCATDVVSAFAAMRGEPERSARRASNAGGQPRAIVFHGSADATVHPSNGARIAAAARTGLDGAREREERGGAPGGRRYTRTVIQAAGSPPALEHWLIHGEGHAWSGGAPAGSYTDPSGPDASAEMVRFFLAGAGPSRGSD